MRNLREIIAGFVFPFIAYRVLRERSRTFVSCMLCALAWSTGHTLDSLYRDVKHEYELSRAYHLDFDRRVEDYMTRNQEVMRGKAMIEVKRMEREKLIEEAEVDGLK